MIKKDDYQEPRCPFDTSAYEQNRITPIPVRRVTEKEDELLSRNDQAGAERLLLYWIEEAIAGHDLAGEFSMHNELMGLYRKMGERDKAIAEAENALGLIPALGYEDSVSGATCYINAGTVYKAFGMADKGLPYFEKARAIYEARLPENDGRLGGLYNNMGLALMDLENYVDAEVLYGKAIKVMKCVTNGELEQAITLLNIANCIEWQTGAEAGAEKIAELVEEAYELLSTESVPRNGYYAFVCEKCAPTFSYYGFDEMARDLATRAEAIYSRDQEY